VAGVLRKRDGARKRVIADAIRSYGFLILLPGNGGPVYKMSMQERFASAMGDIAGDIRCCNGARIAQCVRQVTIIVLTDMARTHSSGPY